MSTQRDDLLNIGANMLLCFLLSGTWGMGQAYANPSTEQAQHIRVSTREGHNVVFRLNNSPAAKAFYNQLPLRVRVKDYAQSEKIFYPPQKLDTKNTALAQGPAGTLAYYAPWGNVAMFYKVCGGGSGLYALGKVISGIEHLSGMTGEILIRKSGSDTKAVSE